MWDLLLVKLVFKSSKDIDENPHKYVWVDNR